MVTVEQEPDAVLVVVDLVLLQVEEEEEILVEVDGLVVEQVAAVLQEFMMIIKVDILLSPVVAVVAVVDPGIVEDLVEEYLLDLV